MSIEFVIRDWAVWTTDVVPLLAEHLPKSLLRRLSPLAKAVFHVVGVCIHQHEALPTVFCSSHGEITRSLALLQDLQAGEALSPTAFSLSVHNAIAGLYSIAYDNHQEITVIASGASGLGPGFIEALGLLQQGHPEVLLVFYDEALPDFFPTAPLAICSQAPAAMALRLAAYGAGQSMGFGLSPVARADGEQPLQLLSFMAFLNSTETCLQLGDQAGRWQWRKT